jgi:hypothetical protein
MAVLWETDCVSVSSLPNNQYPNVAGTWDYIVPHTTISSDGDIHVDTAIDGAGDGAASNNVGESPLICEVINATSNQLNHLDGLTDRIGMNVKKFSVGSLEEEARRMARDICAGDVSD